MIYFIKAKYLGLFFLAMTSSILSSCKERTKELPISVIKTQRTTEAHPEIVISKPKETSLKEVEKDTYKEITQSQKEKRFSEETSLALSELKNTSDELKLGINKNRKEISKDIMELFKSIKGRQKRPLRIAYFNPSDRKPVPDYQNRIQKIMTEIQSFYAKGMEENGFGKGTFNLELENGKLFIHFVQSNEPKNNFSRNGQTAQKIYSLVAKKLKEKGIDLEKETVIVFQNLARIQNNSFYDTDAPYFGRWHTNFNRKGFCYVVDSEFLNWKNLTDSKKKFKFNGERTMTFGELASGQIGGVCHELGHAFCLNHTCDSHKISSKSGTALMGYGNWTFKQELRKQGKGSYLSFVSATKLMAHPCFSQTAHGKREFQLLDISLNSINNILDIQGKINARPDVYAIIGYCDNLNKRSDYDATGWVGSVNTMGNFQISINELKPNTPYKLNLQFLHTNGNETVESIEFNTGKLEAPILPNSLREQIILKPILQAKLKGEKEKVRTLLRNLETNNKCQSINFLLNSIKLMNLNADKTPAQISDNTKSIYLSQTKWTKAYTGYNAPRNNSLHEDNHYSPWPFLSSSSHIHRFGLYAHANSE